MILLISSSPRTEECTAALAKACGETAEVADSTRAALSRLRHNEYVAVVFDENLIDRDALGQATLLRHLGTAVPIHVSFAVNSVDRVVREVELALRRRQHERLIAMRAAVTGLRNDLKGALTGILLSSELALAVPELPDAAQVKIRFVHDLAQSMRRQLEVP